MGKFDISFKLLAERLPFQVLRAFGARPVSRAAVLEAPQREVVLFPTAVDHALIVKTDTETWLEHFESEVGVSGDDLVAVRKRAQALDWKYDMPVWTTILIMSRKAGPVNPLKATGVRRGTLTVVVEPHYVRLWEVAPELLTEDAPVDALPWVAAMNSSPQDLEEMVRKIVAIRDPELRKRLASEAVTLAALKYDKDEVEELRRRFHMVTTTELLLAGCYGDDLRALLKAEGLDEGRQEGREEGRQEGLQAGRQEGLQAGRQEGLQAGRQEGLQAGRQEGIQEGLRRGRVVSARRLVRALCAARLPGDAPPDWIDEINDPDRLEALFDALLAAREVEAEARAVLTAFHP